MLYAVVEADDVNLLAICVFFGTLGLIQMDVMADTMCVERSKFEPDETRVSFDYNSKYFNVETWVI